MSKGIYKIENKNNKMVYIGSSFNIEKRFHQHKQELKKNRHHSYKLQNSYNETKDFESFNFEIVEKLDCSRTELLVREQYYIDKYNAYENGYNCCQYSVNPKYTNNKLSDIHYSHNDNNDEVSSFIPDSIVKNKTFSNYSIAVFCVLQTLSVSLHLYKQCITRNQIEFYLTGQVSKRRRISDYIRCGLQELIDNEIIKKENEIQKHYILDCSKLWIDVKKDKFTTITFGEVKKIFQIDNTNNFLLLRYFVLLMGTISSKITVFLPNGENKNRVVGNVTIDYLSKLSGISERTIIEYNRVLENAGLLYIYRHGDFIIDDGNNIKRMSNIYGRPTDSTYIDKFGVDQKKHHETYRY